MEIIEQQSDVNKRSVGRPSVILKKGIGQEPIPKERVDEELEFSVCGQLNGEANRQRKDEA